jgi:hypothetical protein
MPRYNDKQIEKIKFDAKVQLMKDLSKNIPKNANALDKIVAEQLDRITKDISKWRNNVDSAEDIFNPDRQELIEMFRDFVDDYQLHSTMQARTSQAISGGLRVVDENLEPLDDEKSKFLDPFGFAHDWLIDFMTFVMDSRYYGWTAIQLGDIVNDTFEYVEKIPEENQVPYYDAMIKDANMAFLPGDTNNAIYFEKEPYDTWLVRTGSDTDLGLINKCAPYIIWKSVFGDWSQHAAIFGMPLRVGKTSMADNARKQNMIDAFEEMTGASYIVQDIMDEVELIERKGSSDPHNIYGQLIEKCDQAISKIILSQTGTTDEKAYSGSADVHKSVQDSLVFFDKLYIMSVLNNQLIPRMKKIGMIAQEKKVYIGFDFSEQLTIKEWAEVFSQLSQAGYAVPADEIERRISISVDPTVVAMPENKTFSIMEMYNRILKNTKT